MRPDLVPHAAAKPARSSLAGLAALSLVLLVAPARGEGFDPSPDFATLDSYRQAVAVLDKALEANGGRERILAVRDVSAEIKGNLVYSGRGLRPESPGPEDTFDGVLVMDFDDDWLYLQRNEVSAEGIQGGIRTVLQGETGKRTLYPDAHTSELGAGAAARIKSLMAGRIPFLALRDAWRDRASVRYLGEANAGGRRHHLLLVHREGLPITLFVDAETYLVTKTEHLVAHANFGDSVEEVELSDYRTVAGIQVPFRRFHRQHGLPYRLELYTDVRIDTDPTLPESAAEPPGKLADALPAEAYPIVEEIAPKVYYARFNRVYAALVLVLGDRLLMVDAPGNSEAMEGVLTALRAKVGELALGWVVLTHHHFDHVAGLRPLLAEGATVVAEPTSKPIVEAMAERPRTLEPDRYSREPRPLRFEPVTAAETTLSHGDVDVKLYTVGPTGESEDMLIVYLPAQKLLFQADLLSLVDGRDGLPPAGEKALQLAAAIERLDLDVERLVCSHGGQVDPAAFRDAVRRGRETPAAEAP